MFSQMVLLSCRSTIRPLLPLAATGDRKLTWDGLIGDQELTHTSPVYSASASPVRRLTTVPSSSAILQSLPTVPLSGRPFGVSYWDLLSKKSDADTCSYFSCGVRALHYPRFLMRETDPLPLLTVRIGQTTER